MLQKCILSYVKSYKSHQLMRKMSFSFENCNGTQYHHNQSYLTYVASTREAKLVRKRLQASDDIFLLICIRRNRKYCHHQWTFCFQNGVLLPNRDDESCENWNEAKLYHKECLWKINFINKIFFKLKFLQDKICNRTFFLCAVAYMGQV